MTDKLYPYAYYSTGSTAIKPVELTGNASGDEIVDTVSESNVRESLFNSNTTDRQWLLRIIEVLKECKKNLTYFNLNINNIDDTLIQLEHYVSVFDEQFAKPDDYNQLVAFADRISSIMWGNDIRWVTRKDGLKHLNEAVAQLHKESTEIRTALTQLLHNMNNSGDVEEDENILNEIRNRKRHKQHSYSTDDSLKLGDHEE